MKKVTADGKCSNCGSDDFTLAEDATDYSAVTFEGGRWVRHVTNTELNGESRFFCAKCMTYHTEPEDIE